MKKSKIVLIALLASMVTLASCGKKGDSNNSSNDITEATSDDTSDTSGVITTSEDPVDTLYNITIVDNPYFDISVTNLQELKATFDTPVLFDVISKNSEAILSEVKVAYLKDGNEEIVTTTHQGNTYGFYMPKGDVTISVTSYIPEAPEYNVSAEPNEYVSIALDQTKAKANDTVTFAVSLLDAKREITSVKAYAGTEVITTTYANNKYSFVMPSSDVTIKVETSSTAYHITTRNASHVYFSVMGAKDEYSGGEEIMFVASANYGYILNEVFVTDALGQNIPFTKGETSYTFIMPKSDVVIAFDVEATYQVTKVADSYSSITINDEKDFYKAGTTITFTVDVTNKDFELSSVMVTSATREITYQENNGVYSFVMPSGNVAISTICHKKASGGDVATDPFTTRTSFAGTWTYNDGYTLYYMELTVTFNGDKTLSWKLTYDYDDDDDWWSIKPMMAVTSNISEKASQNNVPYTFDAANDQINANLHIKTSDKAMTIQLVRTANAVSSIYFTSDMSGDFYQCGNHSLSIKK